MDNENKPIKKKPWLVLMATDPERMEYHLQKWNMQQEALMNQESDEKKRQAMQNSCFGSFVPFTTMFAGGEGEDRSVNSISLRTALRRYVFVTGNAVLLRKLVMEWNRMFVNQIFFLKDGTGKNARIRQTDVDRLREVCLGQKEDVKVELSKDNVKVGDIIHLENTPFGKEGGTCQVVDVIPKRDGSVELKVRMKIFGIELDSVSINYRDALSYGNKASMVASHQRTLLNIFCRRVNSKETDVSRHEDKKALDEIAQNDEMRLHKGAMRRHYLALMLICAHMQSNEGAVNHYQKAVLNELVDIARLRESKAATATRAYLHVALYIATGDVKFRNLAKIYIRKYQPSAPNLRKFISTMSKREAAKWIGPKARRKKKQK